MDRGECPQKQPHPRETASVLSLVSFFYTIKLFIKGYKKSLETSDLYAVLNSCSSKDLGDQLENRWRIQKKLGNISIVRAVWQCFGRRFLFLGLIQLVVKVVDSTWSPEAFSKLIAYFSPGQTELSKADAIYYASVVMGLSVLNVFFYHNYTLAQIELGIRTRTAICALLYRKALKLGEDSLSEVTLGKITTIITKDIDAFEMFIQYGNDIWVGMVQTMVICYLIYTKIGIASFAGVLFFMVVLPLQVLIGRMAYTFRLESSQKTDQRLELTQEVLSAIKIIKMYTWERYFEDRIGNARKQELLKLHKLFYTKVAIVVIGGLCSKIAFFLFLMAHVWMGNSITAEIVYYIITCSKDLEFTLSTLIPIGLSYASEVYATAQRVDTVLKSKEVSPEENTPTIKTPKIILRNVSIKNLFSNVNLTITTGLNAVVGCVGSGKTVFLKTILRDFKYNGDVSVLGTISYASQEPWLFPSSIRNNILFGEKYQKERYQKVLQACALTYDLEMLVNGDSTIVGDRGINLSKGQQTRINLARAIYKQSDIYLLDDCLAALDAHVSENIFNECLRKFLDNKIVIFVTNNLPFIKKSDRVILLNESSIRFDEEVQKIPVESTEVQPSEPNSTIKEETIPEKKDIFFETKKTGKVDWRIYKKYIQHGGGVLILSLVLFFFILTQGAFSYSEKLLSTWVTLEQNVSAFRQKNQTSSEEYQRTYQDRTFNLNLYTTTLLSFCVLSLIKSLVFFKFSRYASFHMHKVMLKQIINSSMQFFDTHFIGNILNRFSKDLSNIDEYLPFVIIECLTMIFVVSGGVILLTTVHIIFLIEVLGLFVIACILKVIYQPTGRNLQRLTSLTRSPMIGHLNSTLEGLTTIRASKAQEIILKEFDRHQDLYTSANYSQISSTSALAFFLDVFCTIFVGFVIVQFLVSDFGSSVGDVGLALTQAYVITDLISTGISNLSECENQMTSVERIEEYIDIKQETSPETRIENWPSSSPTIQLTKVSLNYIKDAKEMLSDIELTIGGREKFGIVGRTGSGKSSIISSLFLLYPTEGTITIDGTDVKNLPLAQLRGSIAIIPQDPFFFSGTIRENLDPFRKYRDEEIWKILDELRLRDSISCLDRTLDKASGLSAGQKQLFCLARALLRKTQIVVLDEATANVDQDTDSFIQDLVRKHFSKCTVIIIAHRLSSVLNCHQVAVLNNGRITELDSPGTLLQDKNSFLHYVIK